MYSACCHHHKNENTTFQSVLQCWNCLLLCCCSNWSAMTELLNGQLNYELNLTNRRSVVKTHCWTIHRILIHYCHAKLVTCCHVIWSWSTSDWYFIMHHLCIPLVPFFIVAWVIEWQRKSCQSTKLQIGVRLPFRLACKINLVHLILLCKWTVTGFNFRIGIPKWNKLLFWISVLCRCEFLCQFGMLCLWFLILFFADDGLRHVLDIPNVNLMRKILIV